MYCFSACRSLERINYISKCPRIGASAFYDSSDRCSRLTEVNLSSCVEIGADAFATCPALTRVTLNPNGTYLDDRVFADCYSLFIVDNLKYCSSIGYYAFYRCSGLHNVDISGVEYVGACAFEDSGLETLKLGDGTEFSDPSSGTLFGTATTTLREVTLPSSGYYVPSWMFFGCANLEIVNYLAYATGIGDHAFEGCGKLSNN